MTGINHCGGCTACCNIMKVEELDIDFHKPARTPCAHQCKHGCGIYETRPIPCQGFQCVWLASQERADVALPAALRPDRSNVVLEVNTKNTIIAHCAKESSWREPRMLKWLLKMAQHTTVTLDLPGERVQLLRPDGETEELEFLDVDKESGERRYTRPRL